MEINSTCEKCNKPLNFNETRGGQNKGRFYAKCCKFYWNDSKGYDINKFKNGACYRCGNYGCEVTDCEKTFDWFGNLIPEVNGENFDEYFIEK